MSFTAFLKVSPLRSALCYLALWRVQEKLAKIDSYLTLADRVLDVGAGNCILCQELSRRGHDVTPVDVTNLSFVDEDRARWHTTVRHFPFADDGFDVALVITVLHHAADPDAVLGEVRRGSAADHRHRRDI